MSTLRTNTLQTTDSSFQIDVKDLASQSTPSSKFGTVGDGATDNTAAFNSFLAAVDIGHIPAGVYKITGPLNFKSNQIITGAGPATILIYQATAPAPLSPVLVMTNLTNTKASDFQLRVDPTAYPTARTLYTQNSTDCSFENIEVVGGGGNVSYTTASTRCAIKKVSVDDYRDNGFYVTDGKFCKVEDCSIPNGVGGLMGIQFVNGVGHVAKGNYIAKTPDNYFGIHSHSCDFADIRDNLIENTRREAIAVGGGCIGPRVHNNTLRWTENLGIGDFGMSLAGDTISSIIADFQVTNNTIISPALSGIGVAGFTQRGLISGNTIRDACQASGSTFQQGIKLYGYIAGAVVQDVVVSNNIISKVSGGGMLFAVVETPELGTVSNNTIRDNKAFGLTGFDVFDVSATSSVIAANSDDLSLKPHSAPLLSTAGSVTTSSATLYFQLSGKFAFCTLVGSVSNNGTGSGQLTMTLPFIVSSASLTGAETALGGKACKAGPISGGTMLSITSYDNTYPAASGSIFSLSGVLQLA